MEAMEFLGLDLGLKRTGIARGSSLAKIAQPLSSVPTNALLASLKSLIDQNKTDAIVVGLPRNLRGEDSGQTVWVRQWVAGAKDKIKLPLYWQDEALTSTQAKSKKPSFAKAAADKQKAKSNADEHSLAAAIILQDFLNIPESEWILV